ncbi:MAG: hypothetical protein Q8R53_00455 [Nanoarchaeota archaeon]|nr:hypothetical protein [Nanoarchaeota archaeon]
MGKGKPLQRTLDALAAVSLWKYVRKNCWDVSCSPLASFDYTSCRAIALSDGRSVGLSHIYPIHPPAHYLQPMLDAFLQGNALAKPQAILVAGYLPHELESCCSLYEIPVVGTYYCEPTYDGRDRRDIIVLPERQEVRIYTANAVIVRSFLEECA